MLLKIKEIRLLKNMNQEELALKTGLSKRMIIDYEREIKDIPLQKLQLIANAFEVALFDLINIEMVINYPEQKEKINFVNEKTYNSELNWSLTDAQKKTIEILEREVEDLRNDKYFLKNVIENNLGKVS